MTDRLKSMFLLARSNFGIPGLMGDGNDIIVNEHYIVKRATFPNFTKNDAADLKQWNNLDDSILDIEFVETDTHGETIHLDKVYQNNPNLVHYYYVLSGS